MTTKRCYIFLFFLTSLFACDNNTVNLNPSDETTVNSDSTEVDETDIYLTVLGTVQDAGSPQIACKKDCCIDLFVNPDPSRKVVSLGLVDAQNNSTYLFEATPDLPEQLELLNRSSGNELDKMPDAVFLTHAHIGHYTGLMYFGKEAMNANQVPVYAMPRMNTFLTENGPWSQLVANENIQLTNLEADKSLALSKQLSITPILVPHRDEYSETVGYIISGPNKSALFIPDIDKWEKWDRDIITLIQKVDYAFLDATFYDAEEINNRDISEIPHPFVIESMATFADISSADKAKIYFIHFNHTNPLLKTGSEQQKKVIEAGFNFAEIETVFAL